MLTKLRTKIPASNVKKIITIIEVAPLRVFCSSFTLLSFPVCITTGTHGEIKFIYRTIVEIFTAKIALYAAISHISHTIITVCHNVDAAS